MSDHELTLTRDEPHPRGWLVAWRCSDWGCDSRGNAVLPDRDQAMAWFAISTVLHPQAADPPGVTS